jgi:hypothetical protein
MEPIPPIPEARSDSWAGIAAVGYKQATLGIHGDGMGRAKLPVLEAKFTESLYEGAIGLEHGDTTLGGRSSGILKLSAVGIAT